MAGFIKSQLRNAGRPIRLSNTKFIRFLVYASNDTKAEIIAAGYFNNAKPDLSVGSIIDVEADCDGTQESVRLRVTAVPTSGNVTVADVTWDIT